MIAGVERRLGRIRARLLELAIGPPLELWDDDADEPPTAAADTAPGRRDTPAEAGVTLADPVAADLATALWRARRRLEHGHLPDASDDGRFLGRHLRAMAEALERGEVRTVEHDGERFVAGMRLDVLAFQPTPDLETDTVVETIRPAVYHGSRQIQVAEVIVGTPDPGDDDDHHPAEPVDNQEDQGDPIDD